jgi:cytochrome oxidase assembly protein ShyY1
MEDTVEMNWKAIVISGLITIATLTATGLGAWNLSKTASIPETYATKKELKESYDRNVRDHDKIRDEQKGEFEELRTEQRYIRDAVDDIKNILINRGRDDR